MTINSIKIIFCFLILFSSCQRDNKSIDLRKNIENLYQSSVRSSDCEKNCTGCEIDLSELPFMWDELYILDLDHYPETHSMQQIQKYIKSSYTGKGRKLEEQLLIFFYKDSFVGEYREELYSYYDAYYRFNFIFEEKQPSKVIRKKNSIFQVKFQYPGVFFLRQG